MIDLLVVGDIGIDTYYMLDSEDASVRHTGKDKEAELCLDLSEKIPVEDIHTTIGGNAANAAVGASRLGLTTSLLSSVGKDEDGRSILSKLEKEDIDLHNIKQEGVTNQTAALVYKGKRTLLVHHEDRKYTFGSPPPARWLYLSSTNIGGLKIVNDVVNYANKHNTKIVFSPGTLQRKAGPSAYKELLEICDLLIMNREEAIDFTKSDEEGKIPALLEKMLKLGPSRAVITDSTKGSFGSDGEAIFFMNSCPAKTVDNTGAGDSYSIALTVALARGETLDEGMRWGAANSASVTEHIGPQQGLLSLPRLKNRLDGCPEPKEI